MVYEEMRGEAIISIGVGLLPPTSATNPAAQPSGWR